MADTAIWAAALFVPLTILVLAVLKPLRRGLDKWGDSLGPSPAGEYAKLADAAERQFQAAIARATEPERIAAEKARLAAVRAQYETDALAAGKTLDAAMEGRQRVLAARADAEAALAPDAAKAALEGDGGWLAQAYAAYCDSYGYSDPLPFGRWIQGFDGVRHG